MEIRPTDDRHRRCTSAVAATLTACVVVLWGSDAVAADPTVHVKLRDDRPRPNRAEDAKKPPSRDSTRPSDGGKADKGDASERVGAPDRGSKGKNDRGGKSGKDGKDDKEAAPTDEAEKGPPLGPVSEFPKGTPLGILREAFYCALELGESEGFDCYMKINVSLNRDTDLARRHLRRYQWRYFRDRASSYVSRSQPFTVEVTRYTPRDWEGVRAGFKVFLASSKRDNPAPITFRKEEGVWQIYSNSL